MLHPARSADPERRRRFVQEAKAASALNHPNIVTIYDVGEEAGADFIVMEHVVGTPLSLMIPQTGMRVSDAIAIAIPVADSLELLGSLSRVLSRHGIYEAGIARRRFLAT